MSADQMTKLERVQAAVRGEPVDRVPFSFWHHFQVDESGRKLAEATLDFFVDTFDLDLVKIMPDVHYPFPRYSIHQPEDWLFVEAIDPARSRFVDQVVTAVRLVRQRVGQDVPVVFTVFSPLFEALRFVPDAGLLMRHASEHPARLHHALATIADNERALIRAGLDAGADGVYFAQQGCTTDAMTVEQYRELGRPYDLIALQGATNGWLNILHVHGDKNLMLDEMLDYPVQVLNWSDRLAGPSLSEVRATTNLCLMGGWNEYGPLSKGPVEGIRDEAVDAIEQTGGRKLILSSGCNVPRETDERWLRGACDIVRGLRAGSYSNVQTG